jgi:hypothetical protein
VMGVSKGTIMSRLFHARQKLQRALVDCYEEQVGKSPSTESAAAAAERGSNERASESTKESAPESAKASAPESAKANDEGEA